MDKNILIINSNKDLLIPNDVITIKCNFGSTKKLQELKKNNIFDRIKNIDLIIDYLIKESKRYHLKSLENIYFQNKIVDIICENQYNFDKNATSNLNKNDNTNDLQYGSDEIPVNNNNNKNKLSLVIKYDDNITKKSNDNTITKLNDNELSKILDDNDPIKNFNGNDLAITLDNNSGNCKIKNTKISEQLNHKIISNNQNSTKNKILSQSNDKNFTSDFIIIMVFIISVLCLFSSLYRNYGEAIIQINDETPSAKFVNVSFVVLFAVVIVSMVLQTEFCKSLCIISFFILFIMGVLFGKKTKR
jgi:hypothetical protein